MHCEKILKSDQSQTVMHRFRAFLTATGHPFSISNDRFMLFDLPNVIISFGERGVEVERPNFPTRLIAYAKLDFDRLLLMTAAPQDAA